MSYAAAASVLSFIVLSEVMRPPVSQVFVLSTDPDTFFLHRDKYRQEDINTCDLKEYSGL